MIFSKKNSQLDYTKLFYYILEGSYGEAFGILKNIYDGKEIPNDFYFLMGGLLRKLNDYEGALQVQKNLLSSGNIEQKNILIYEIVANLLGQGKIRDAVDVISDFLRKDDDKKLQNLLPELLYSIEDFETAAEHFKKNKNDVMVSFCYYRRAMKLGVQSGDYADYLLRALKYNNKLRSAKFDLSGYYFQQGKSGKALDLLIDTIYNDLPKSLDDLYYIKDKFKSFADLLQFEKLIRKRVDELSSNPFYYIYLSEDAYLSGDFDRSKEILVNYTNSFNVSKTILKQYAKILNDPFFIDILMNEHTYACGNCKATFKSFFSICPSCRYVDTIDPV